MPKWQDTPDGVHQILIEPWTFLGVRVPAGFRTDGTSSPYIFRAVVPRRGRYVFASYLHDYCLTVMPRKCAAWYFCEALKELGAPQWQIAIRYGGVRLFDRWRAIRPKK